MEARFSNKGDIMDGRSGAQFNEPCKQSTSRFPVVHIHHFHAHNEAPHDAGVLLLRNLKH